MLSFTRDTFESHILVQCCPEELTFIKINKSTSISKSTSLIHGLKYPVSTIISAGRMWSQNLEAVFQDKQSRLSFWGYQHLCCCQQLFFCGLHSLVSHICLLHAHPLYSQRGLSPLVLSETVSIASWRRNSCSSQYLNK